ncbi:MAG TPA: peptidase S41, partial [Prolixibacteraceae bacterium]|nr:peptidase S41 [Prolixibacteraceae bacterium]
YSHRNEDGSVGHIPDSLISEFSTRNGRKVCDGGGVVPDILVEEKSLSNLSVGLITQFKMFDYATKFRTENATIKSVGAFDINDSIYSDFVNYVEKSNFTYTSETQEVLKELRESAKEEKYLDLAEEQIKELEKTLTPDLDRDLNRFREEISLLLENEIIARYYYQKGSTQATLETDDAVKKAKEILANSADYKKTLLPK